MKKTILLIKRRITLTFTFICAVTGGFALFFYLFSFPVEKNILPKHILTQSDFPWLAMFLLSALSVIAIFLKTYLSDQVNNKKENEFDFDEIINNAPDIKIYRNYYDKIKQVETKLANRIELLEKNYGINDIVNISENIRNNIKKGLAKEVKEEYEFLVKNQVLKTLLNQKIRSLYIRLLEERKNAFRRGNFNLVLGFIFSVSGFAVLAWELLFPSNGDLVHSFLPRITFTILLQLFAFFFLKLYRRGLDEVRYYQGELTNMEARFIALDLALQTNNKESIAAIIANLISTERNFILQKGESTVDIERAKIDASEKNEIIDILKGALKNKDTI